MRVRVVPVGLLPRATESNSGASHKLTEREREREREGERERERGRERESESERGASLCAPGVCKEVSLAST